MINLLLGLITLSILTYILTYIVRGELTISPLIGIMVGALHSRSDYEDATEHTVQVCVFIIAITLVWETPNG